MRHDEPCPHVIPSPPWQTRNLRRGAAETLPWRFLSALGMTGAAPSMTGAEPRMTEAVCWTKGEHYAHDMEAMLGMDVCLGLTLKAYTAKRSDT